MIKWLNDLFDLEGFFLKCFAIYICRRLHTTVFEQNIEEQLQVNI